MSLADKVRGLYRVVFPLSMVVAAVCVEQNPLVSITAMGVSGWIVYRLNKGEKGGQA